ncbi:unnamed protein product [Brugia timori]|uniref:DDE_Tnp_1_7 domain-containing protein n=1 Tax=Brugia timori TaxID=42155 RepID=A0A0R3QTT0_9BILA|nr:unnamed protein product [Brugia timori]
MAIINHCHLSFSKLRKANSPSRKDKGITTLYPLICATVLNSKLLTVRQQYELPKLLKLRPKFHGFLNATTEVVDFWGVAYLKNRKQEMENAQR